MAKSELKDLYCKIARPDVECKYFSDSIDFAGIIDNFKNVENQDKPDGIIPLGDTVYMVEHFQISIYGRKKQDGKWIDELQRALGAKDSRGAVALYDDCIGWERQLLNNWRTSFADHLGSHLKHYPTYEENTNKKYPHNPHKFILMIEDNSNSIITNDGLCILDIQEFVEEILVHREIDGVIVFNTSTRGNSVIAKDRSYLEADSDSGKLRPISSCDILALIADVITDKFTPEQKDNIVKEICRILGNLKENMLLGDDVQVIKHDESEQTQDKPYAP